VLLANSTLHGMAQAWSSSMTNASTICSPCFNHLLTWLNNSLRMCGSTSLVDRPPFASTRSWSTRDLIAWMAF